MVTEGGGIDAHCAVCRYALQWRSMRGGGISARRPRRVKLPAVVVLVFALAAMPQTVPAWNNGQSGNTTTSTAAECFSPPYATHDWIADHGFALLPAAERAWMEPHRAMYLLGTEAPDNRHIPDTCGTPNSGYDDRSRGHSVEWAEDWSVMVKDRAAVRAQEEYEKAAAAFKRGDAKAAAFYLGAMAHYIGDACQYGHAVSFETKQHHAGYEAWAARLTPSFGGGGMFERYIHLAELRRRRPYEAVERVSLAVARGEGKILSAREMEARYALKGQEYVDSAGTALNMGATYLADVLHTFYLDVVSQH